MMTLKTVQKTEVHPSRQEAEVEEPSFEVVLESVARMYCPVCKQKMNTSAVKALSEGRCPSCGENVLVQGKIGSYRVLRMLGHGGMGVVYEGFDEGLGRKVAIKVTQVDVTQDKEMLATFQREAQVVARLNHPNIVQVYAFGEEKGHPYLVMELLSSGSLMDLIKEDEPIGEAFLMGVAYEIAEGLNAAQDAGLLHGDIKPENILFDDKMHAKLVDFGIAAMQVSKTSHEVWGTPYYIAPEKVVERKSNHRCDIYSLGATLYHAMAKRPPFNGTDPTMVIRAAIDGKAQPLSNYCPDINPEVEAIITRMMEKDTNLRYPSYKSIISDVKKYLSTVPRERLRRTSHIVISGPKKIKKATQKAVPIKLSSTAPVVTASQLLENTVPSQATRLFKTFGVKIVLLAACVSVLFGVMYSKVICKNEDQNALYLQAWGLERQYCRAFVSMTNALSRVEALTAEAQALIKEQQDQSSSKKTMGSSARETNESLDGYQNKFKQLFNEAVIIRDYAEIAKVDPFLQKNVDAPYLEELKLGLEKQREYAQAMMTKGVEAKTLLSEMRNKAASMAQSQQATPKPLQPPKLIKELACGSGCDFATVKFMGMKELHDFRMNEKDLLILAVWSPQPEVECGAELNTLALTRREGGKAFISSPGKTLNFGPVSLMGLSTRSQFPVIEAIADSQVGEKSNEWVVASMPNIMFEKSLTKDAMVYKAAGIPESQAGEKRLHASALVFEARLRGSYSLDGQMVLQGPNDTAKVSWMIWIARSE